MWDPATNAKILPVLMIEAYFDMFPYLFQVPTFTILKRIPTDNFYSNAENNSVGGKSS